MQRGVKILNNPGHVYERPWNKFSNSGKSSFHFPSVYCRFRGLNTHFCTTFLATPKIINDASRFQRKASSHVTVECWVCLGDTTLSCRYNTASG